MAWPWVGFSSRGLSTCVEVAAARSAAGGGVVDRDLRWYSGQKLTFQLVVVRSFPRSHFPKYQ